MANFLNSLLLTPPPWLQPIRRKVFISYYHGDQWWAQHFVDTFATTAKVFIPKALGLNYENDEIQSTNATYVIDQIRERYIVDSTIQIVLLGACTHSRRYIDWEIKRSLRNGNGLLGIILPPHVSVHLPDRFAANYEWTEAGYAALRLYPRSPEELRSWIEEVFLRKTTRDHRLVNATEVWLNNRPCQICGLTH